MFNAPIKKEKLISLIDLTSLNEQDTEQTIDALCEKAATSLGNVAAVCIYPHFVKLSKTMIQDKCISVATVANFPSGDKKLTTVLTEIERALMDGADEIDVVIPYQDYLAGNKQSTLLLVTSCKQLCSNKILKVILETGALMNDKVIYDASCRVLDSGADFIKTSTGKITIGATKDAAQQMLNAIKTVNPEAGFKASGGVRTPEQAENYLELAREIMGEHWCTAKHLRIGASSLLDALLQQ